MTDPDRWGEQPSGHGDERGEGRGPTDSSAPPLPGPPPGSWGARTPTITVPSAPPVRTDTGDPGTAAREQRSGFRMALIGGLIGAVLGTSMTLAVVRAVPGFVVDVAPQVTSPTVETAGDGDLTVVQAVAEAVTPSVVRVDIIETATDPASPGELGQRQTGNGSGVIYRSDGYILTNAHVVDGADALRVKLANGDELDATVVGVDPLTDLAVLKVDRSGLPAIRVRTGPPVRVGEVAVAIGSPFGLDATVTAGVVSAVNRDLSVPAGQDRDVGFLIPNVVQTDAAINPGNSGGALVDAQGRLIGINTAILTGTGGSQGVGFAISAEEAVTAADELIDRGRVQRAYLGIAGVDLTRQVAEEFGLEVEGGAVIDRVEPGTAADDAGLQAGDIIIELDGEPLDSMSDLAVDIRRRDPGERITLTVVRDGRRLELEVTLGERPGS